MPLKVNDQPIRCFNFPGGECSVDISGISIGPDTNIQAYIHSSNDLISLLLLVNAVRAKSGETRISLEIPYFPYARQDRVCNPGEAFSLAVVADLINGLHCKEVKIYDPHSEVTPNLIRNCKVISQEEILSESEVEKFIKAEGLTLLSPDKGAAKKTEKYSQVLADKGFQVEALYCTKVRDPKTGKISHTEVPANVGGKSFIILDDICDGGRTFIEIARLLKQHGANRLYLYVTHGIFSKGLEPLAEFFDRVFCYHTFLDSSQSDSQILTVIGD